MSELKRVRVSHDHDEYNAAGAYYYAADVEALLAATDGAVAELRGIDAVLARRDALERYATREEKILHILHVARLADPKAEIGRLEADLAASREELAVAESARAHFMSALDEETALRERLASLLTRTADVLKGDPGPLRLHDWSDLPDVAAVMRAALEAAHAQIARLCRQQV